MISFEKEQLLVAHLQEGDFDFDDEVRRNASFAEKPERHDLFLVAGVPVDLDVLLNVDVKDATVVRVQFLQFDPGPDCPIHVPVDQIDRTISRVLEVQLQVEVFCGPEKNSSQMLQMIEQQRSRVYEYMVYGL